MDVFSLLSSVSKVAIGAFVVTLGIVIYEVILIFRSHADAEQKVAIPEFRTGEKATQSKVLSTEMPAPPTKKQVTRRDELKKKLVWLLALLSILGLLALGTYLYRKLALPKFFNKNVTQVLPTESPETASPTPGEGKAPKFEGGGGAGGLPPTAVPPTAAPTSTVTPTITEEAQLQNSLAGEVPTATVATAAPTRTPTPTSGSISATATPTTGQISELPQSGIWSSVAMVSAIALLLILLAFVV